jgi:hypothetical protein
MVETAEVILRESVKLALQGYYADNSKWKPIDPEEFTDLLVREMSLRSIAVVDLKSGRM